MKKMNFGEAVIRHLGEKKANEMMRGIMDKLVHERNKHCQEQPKESEVREIDSSSGWEPLTPRLAEPLNLGGNSFGDGCYRRRNILPS